MKNLFAIMIVALLSSCGTTTTEEVVETTQVDTTDVTVGTDTVATDTTVTDTLVSE